MVRIKLPGLAPISFPSRSRALLFFGAAMTAGFFLQATLVTLSSSSRPHSSSTPSQRSTNLDCHDDQAYTRLGLDALVLPGEDFWTPQRLREHVQTTGNRYFVRDWSLTLGWNNLRYILEASLYHAMILNRTLVVPSYVYARSCEHEHAVCALYATQIRRNEETGLGDFSFLSEDKQQAWKLPISLMVDLPRLRRIHPVITTAEYLEFHGLSPSLERKNGHWDRDAYHVRPEGRSQITLGVIPHDQWEPTNVVRVDRIPKNNNKLWRHYEDSALFKALRERLGDAKGIDLDTVKELLQSRGLLRWNDDADLARKLRKKGWTILYTFRGVWMEMLKTVDGPLEQVAITSQLRGLVDEYESNDADVLLLEGEVHSNTKPAHLRFTTAQARTDFAALVLNGVHPIPQVLSLAERIAQRMTAENKGRQWMSAHMRRGDFVTFGWAPSSTVEGHVGHIKEKLSKGLPILQEIFDSNSTHTVNVPGITPSTFFNGNPPPLEEDKFFIATDESTKEGKEYIRSQGGVMIYDLIKPEDRRVVGWPLLVTDVLAQLEQVVAAHGAYFWAHAMSSFGGGVVNLRVGRGMDPRTNMID